MDFADLAEFNEARDRDLALSQRAPEGPRATGKCLHCDEPVPVGRRWCDQECRDDWQFARERRHA